MSAQKNPLEMLFQWAEKHPDKPYLFQPHNGQQTIYTWGQVADQVRRMGAALKQLLPEPGTRIAITGRNTAHWFMADLAIAAAGHVSIGLYPKQATATVKYILDHSETKAVFFGPMPDEAEFVAGLPAGVKKIAMPYPEIATKCDHRWDDLVQQHAPLKDSEIRKPKDDDLQTLIYTSGTTGNPKGVMITFRNVTFTLEGLLKELPAQGQERFFSYLPLAHAFERGVVEVGSLAFGAEVHFLENIEKLAEQLPQVAPTRFFAVPLVYGRIQSGVLRKLPQDKLDRINRIPFVRGFIRRKILTGIGLQNARMCFSGAAPLPLPTMEWFKKYLGLEILQGYGMTENMIYASCNRPGQNRIGSVGREMPGANTRISAEGEIQYRHPGVMTGYYKDPEKTKETFTADGYLKTGDKGRLDADGYLYITGRVKDIFKTLKGKYVAPAPIEGAMARNTDIDQLCFVGSGLKQPIMLVSLTPSARSKSRDDVGKGLTALMDEVNKTLENHEEIAKIIVVKDLWTMDNGIMTPTMKVKRDQVEKRYAALITAEAEKRTPLAWEA